MGQFGIGQSVKRVEDRRFITGQGRYTADIQRAGQAHAVLLRSSQAHAKILNLDITEAQAAPGVLGVYTIQDLDADGLHDLPCPARLKNRDGSPRAQPPRPVLARGKVRHVGEPIALVVAESPALARAAADLILLDLEDLDPVVSCAAALAPNAPQLFETEVPRNLCFDWGAGDEDAVATAFAQAAHRVDLDIINPRVIVNSLEPRAAIGEFDQARQRYRLHTSTQGSHDVRGFMAAVFGVPEHRIHVITPDVGGGFGMKLFLYPEHVLVCWAARKLGCPVKWVGERSDDAFLSDTQGRDHVTRASLALDAAGKILGLKVETEANLGAYLSNYAPFIPTGSGSTMLVGVYDIPAVSNIVKGVMTNTVPVDAYRGAGRPEASYVIERLMDEAAIALGLDPADIRRRNFITPAQMPYKTAMGEVYDSGEFALLMDQALAKAGWANKDTKRQAAKKTGKAYGMGFAYYIEGCSGGGDEQAQIRLRPDGAVDVTIGTQSNGQGHETAYAQIVADHLGLDIHQVFVQQGDSDAIPYGNGTGGSRSIPVGGSALTKASETLIAKGKVLAALYLKGAVEDITFTEGHFRLADSNQTASLAEIAKFSYKSAKLPEDLEPGLQARGAWKPPQKTYPNGCHIAELEVDLETGVVTLLSYCVVDDFGVLLNPMLVLGQVQGGVAQGLGQAFLEHTVYDPESGQLLSGSFTDYALPRADNLVEIDFETRNVPCTTNLLGMKGCGEAGTIAACPALMNALLDALRPEGISHLDMPATPHRIWQALQARA